MIICGFGSTRFYGNTLKNMENVLNILCGLRAKISRMYGREHADELLVALVKLVVCGGTDREQEAKAELILSVANMTGSEGVVLEREEDDEM